MKLMKINTSVGKDDVVIQRNWSTRINVYGDSDEKGVMLVTV